MTPPLPKQIREAMEKVAKDLMVGKGTVYPDPDDLFKYGAEWLYSHLTGLAEKGFDEDALYAHFCYASGVDKDKRSIRYEWFEYGAKWQHAQTQALIALKDAEIERLKKLVGE